jgi:GntR family transcriptional regulator
MRAIAAQLRSQLSALRRSGTPRYAQLRTALYELIQAGVLGPGAALPSERELERLTGWSRVTVRKALEQLISEGVVTAKGGSG